MNSEKNTLAGIACVVAVVALLAAGYAAFPGGGQLGGSVIETQQTDFQNGLKVAGELIFEASGSNSVLSFGTSDITDVVFGTANAATTLLPLEATSTDSFTLAATGVTSASKCVVSLPNYDLAFGSLNVTGVTASTNTITFGIANHSGAATSSFPLATTSVAYYCVR